MASNVIYDLESQLDIDCLEKLHFEICVGIAKSKLSPSVRLIPHYEQRGELDLAIEYKNSEKARIAAVADDSVNVLTPEESLVYNQLTYVQKRNLIEMYCGGFHDGDFLRLKFIKEEYLNDKFATFYDSKTEWIENHKYFPNLVTWIKNLPFIEIGRILIFITRQYMHGDIHYDRRDDWIDGRHHFIWFNPFNQKKFFLINNEYKKEYVTSKAIFFDTGYLHGSDPVPKTTYSLRIDGQLSEEFCNLNKIPWKAR